MGYGVISQRPSCGSKQRVTMVGDAWYSALHIGHASLTIRPGNQDATRVLPRSHSSETPTYALDPKSEIWPPRGRQKRFLQDHGTGMAERVGTHSRT